MIALQAYIADSEKRFAGKKKVSEMDSLVERFARSYLQHISCDEAGTMVDDIFTGVREPVNYSFINSIEHYACVLSGQEVQFRTNMLVAFSRNNEIPLILEQAVEAELNELDRLYHIIFECTHEKVDWQRNGF